MKIELGKLSPVNIYCEDGRIELQHFNDITTDDIKLLNDLFSGRTDYTKKEKHRLIYLDKYLDIPL